MRDVIRPFLASVLLLVLMAGCAAPIQKISNTASGKPEATIVADVSDIKGAIISDLVNHGYQIEKDTPYLLEMARPTKNNEDLAAYFVVGNAYSTNHRVVTYTFVKVNDGVRVIASPSIRAQLPGGKINSADLSDVGSIYNTFQNDLINIKTRLEKR